MLPLKSLPDLLETLIEFDQIAKARWLSKPYGSQR
jgi:hypothetical protein